MKTAQLYLDNFLSLITNAELKQQSPLHLLKHNGQNSLANAIKNGFNK